MVDSENGITPMPRPAKKPSRRTLATIEDLFSDLLPPASVWRGHSGTSTNPILFPTSKLPIKPAGPKPPSLPASVETVPCRLEPDGNKVRYFREQIRSLYGNPIEIVLNRNFSTYISFCRPKRGQPPRLSVHVLFVGAGPEVLHALAQFARRPTATSRKVLREFMNSNQGKFEQLAACLLYTSPSPRDS